MAFPSVTNTFVNGTTADADEVNQNFSDIIDGVSDGTKDIEIANATISGVLALTGAATLSSTLDMTGDLDINSNFTVAAATGNTVVGGTLQVTGAATTSSSLGVTGDFAVNVNKFTVTAVNGNTAVAGTLNVTGNTSITGDLSVGASWTVDGATGNTVIGGTLNVTGITTIGTANITTLNVSGAAGVDGDFDVNTNKFTVASASGNVSIFGTTAFGDDLAVNTDKLTVDASTGNTQIAGTLNADGDLTVNTNKFEVLEASGNTTVAGTLTVTDDLSINGNFDVTAASGNTTVGGTLSVTGAMDTTSTLDVGGDFSVATNKLTVDSGTGDTTIAGTLIVTGATIFQSTVNVVGNFSVNTGKFVSKADGSFHGFNTTVAHGSYSPLVEVYNGIFQVYSTSATRLVNLESNAATVFLNLENNSTSAGNTCYQRIRTDAVGDAYTEYSNSTTQWSAGIDATSDSDFVISANIVPGTNNAIICDRTTQSVTLPSLNAPAAGKYRPVYADENGKLEVSWTDYDAKEEVSTFEVYNDQVATAVTGTANYYRVGKMVVCSLPTMVGTSTNTANLITGIPAAIQPDADRSIGAYLAYNNGNACLGHVKVEASGQFRIGHCLDDSTDIDVNESGWQNSGTKGLAPCVLTWFLC